MRTDLDPDKETHHIGVASDNAWLNLWDCPSTPQVRYKLERVIKETMRDTRNILITAPTALGKSTTIAKQPWTDEDEITDSEPVIHLSGTKEARDDGYETTKKYGNDAAKLESREDACSTAAGTYDEQITKDRIPASEWIAVQCDEKNMAFSSAHAYLTEQNDQGRDSLPCEAGEDEECRAKRQWENIPRDTNGNPTADTIHATHQFGNVPGLFRDANVIIDEEVTFSIIGPGDKGEGSDGAEMTGGRIRAAINAYLADADTRIDSAQMLINIATGWLPDAAEEFRKDFYAILDYEPDTVWYFQTADAHAMAPALTEALLCAANAEPDANDRRYSGHIPYHPPRIDNGETYQYPYEPDDKRYDPSALAAETDHAERRYLSMVLDDDDNITTVRSIPNLDKARCVIALDAHPTPELWTVNLGEGLGTTKVLDNETRKQWRRYERGLTVIQVGDNTRTVGREGKYFNSEKCRHLLNQIYEEHGDEFRTVVCPKAVRDEVLEIMREIGIADPDTITYGKEKSNNAFEGESVGAVLYCIDPGDDYVLDVLAELEMDAQPEMDGEKRVRGCEFVGPDADHAASILGSIRENHVAQGIGRWARKPDYPDDGATVYVWTNVAPDHLIDYETPSVDKRSDGLLIVMEALHSIGAGTTARIAAKTDISQGMTRKHLRTLDDDGFVTRYEIGDTTEWEDNNLPDNPQQCVVDINDTPDRAV